MGLLSSLCASTNHAQESSAGSWHSRLASDALWKCNSYPLTLLPKDIEQYILSSTASSVIQNKLKQFQLYIYMVGGHCHNNTTTCSMYCPLLDDTPMGQSMGMEFWPAASGRKRNIQCILLFDDTLCWSCGACK